MAKTLKDFLNKVLVSLKNLDKSKKKLLFVLSATLIVIITISTLLLSHKSYTVLYTDMDAQEAGEVMARLDEMGVDAKASGEDTILVESDKADSVRMQLAAEGYPSSGLNYDIFKQASGLGTTDLEKQVYLQLQLQENLRKTLRQLEKVEDAVVNLNLSKDSPFVLSDDEKPATAAVMLKLKAGKTINQEEVRAIAELVSKSISGLSIENVRIVDTNMNLYKISDETEQVNAGSQYELAMSVRDQLQSQVMNLLIPVFGDGRVLAQVNVVLDFDKKVTESVKFEPPVEGSNEGLAVSVKELVERIYGEEGGTVGVDPNTGAPSYQDLTDEDSTYYKKTKETNLELNETRTRIEQAQGKIEKLSVSVIVDSAKVEGDYSENIKKLISTAVGVDNEYITVDMLPFNAGEDTDSDDVFNKQKDLLDSMHATEITKLIILVAASLAALLLLVIMVKTLKSRPAVQTAGVKVDLMADEKLDFDEKKEIPITKEDTNLTQLEKYIDASPQSVAQLLRNWLSDESGR